MSYGTAIYVAGKTYLDPGGAGGAVYLGKVTVAVNSSATYTYPDVPGGSHLRVFLVVSGDHTFSTGTNGSGQATLTITAKNSGSAYAVATTAAVFAALTVEPTYGVSLLNDAGERLVSSMYPLPNFLGKFTLSLLSGGGSTQEVYQTTTSLGSGQDRLIMFKLPDTTDVWYYGTSFVSSSVTGDYNIQLRVFRPNYTSTTIPDAYVFGIQSSGAAPASSEQYGIRIYNSGGALMYDSGNKHLSLKRSTAFDFPATGNTETGYTVSQMSGITPLVWLPTHEYLEAVYSHQGFGPGGVMVPYYNQFFGRAMMRKNGTTLYARHDRVQTGTTFSPIVYNHGQLSNLFTMVADSYLYD